MGAVTAAVIGAVAVAGAGYMQSRATNSAANKNLQAQMDANKMNQLLFHESRGASGSAVLPEYMPAGSEARVGRSLLRAHDAIAKLRPDEQLAIYQQILDDQQGNIDAGNKTIEGIFDGSITMERLQALAPVAAARLNAAAVNADSIDLALQQQKQAIDAADAAKGFTGAGSAVNNRLLAATIAARQAAAGQKAQAELLNASDVRNVQDSGTDLRIRSLDVPVNRASQLMQLKNAPGVALANRESAAFQPLNLIRIGTGNAPTWNAPQISAAPSGAAAILSGVGSLAGGISQYAAAQQLQQQQAAQNAALISAINSANAGPGLGSAGGVIQGPNVGTGE